jgi:hypothetical protein
MNTIGKIALIGGGGLLGLATSLTVLGAIVGPARPVATAATTTTAGTTSTVSATATPTPTPRAAACPSGSHNGGAADTYSGCFADPTATPAPSQTCYRLMTGHDSDSGARSIIELKATGADAEYACMGMDAQDGRSQGTITFAVTPATHLASDAHLNCTTTVAGSNVAVYDNGTLFSRAAASGFCKG